MEELSFLEANIFTGYNISTLRPVQALQLPVKKNCEL